MHIFCYSISNLFHMSEHLCVLCRSSLNNQNLSKPYLSTTMFLCEKQKSQVATLKKALKPLVVSFTRYLFAISSVAFLGLHLAKEQKKNCNPRKGTYY